MSGRILRISVGILLLIITLKVQAFRFQDTDGKIHTLADYKGRWVIVNFWATWCPPCLEEIPDLIALYEERDDVMVIGVAMEFTDPDVVMAFAQSMSITYPTVLGSRRIASQLDDISLLPSTYFFDPEGRPAARQRGIVTRESIEDFINAR
ncbi:TlpA disulfide reductase family protein [Nitrosomonas sp.]|uniref:TlpA family protein disulfide reductase n=1 Tax=Nitrosomonas sp. TaxID=42353 RepID=UPI00284A8FC3|nr:TlpA disulfide reductase family protein [Nitrosomonas sp.]MCP5242187.1 TlpA family protein disulfide reductase [Burkholderiales bacterium]MDR4514231.1 TlpA family protein disulfide reductase [Nitrosomonas sp.]